MLIRKRGGRGEKKKEAVELSTLSFPVILIRNVNKNEDGVFIFHIKAGRRSNFSVLFWYSALF